MLVSLKMRRWRKHEDKTITFTAGLNAVRGANENGKTSMLLAIIYALWGVKALPLPLSEMVTWGYEEKDALSELVIQIDGEMYAFKRSKSGAECNHSGGVVTGQDEVSNFATKLLGVDAKLAQSLMFASQKAMSGALESGPTAVNEYIEGLAGMDLFDTLMDLISEKWTTGPTTRLDATVAELEGRIEAGGPVAPDCGEQDKAIESLTSELVAQEGALTTHEDNARDAADAYNQAKAKSDLRISALANLKSAEESLGNKKRSREADTYTVESTELNLPRISQLEGLMRDAMALEATKRAHTAFSKLVIPEDVWEGDEASLKAEIDSVGKVARGITQQYTTLHADIRVMESKVVTSSVCGFCNQDMSQFPEVARKNAELTEQIALKKDEARSAVAEETEKLEELSVLRAVLESATPFNTYLRQFGQYVEVDTNFVPPRISWKGEPPAGDADSKSLQSELNALVAAKQRVEAANARLTMLEQDIIDGEAQVERLKSAIPPEVSLDLLYHGKLQAETLLADLQKSILKHRTTIQNLEAVKAQKLAEHKVQQRAFDQLAVTLAASRSERDELVATNTLVKKIKAARPAIAAELWGMVLSVASVMFSNMRGEQSIITKSPKDFLVNGKTYKGLSGSATDLMGYALRVSLIKTFIPDCSFMVMDEASAACDENRTMSLFGFIASAGFPQTLLVTHDPMAESVADSVIMI